MARAAARSKKKTPSRLIAKTRRHSSSPTSTVWSESPPTPAQHTSTSSGPSSRSTCATATSACPESVTSPAMPSTSSGAPDGSRSKTATRAPRSRRSDAAAAPIPLAPPVTSAVRPSKSPTSAGHVRRAALGQDEVGVAVGHVVERHGRQRLEERHPALGVQLVLDATVDADDVAGAQLARLVADRHRHRALHDGHELLRVLVGVALALLARLVPPPAQQDLVAADGVQPHAIDELEGLAAVPGPERGRLRHPRPRSPRRRWR